MLCWAIHIYPKIPVSPASLHSSYPPSPICRQKEKIKFSQISELNFKPKYEKSKFSCFLNRKLFLILDSSVEIKAMIEKVPDICFYL